MNSSIKREYEMSEGHSGIEWGPEIKVNGMPYWINADQVVWGRWGSDHWFIGKDGAPKKCYSSREDITCIRLPADHWYYGENKIKSILLRFSGMSKEQIEAEIIGLQKLVTEKLASRSTPPRDTEGRFISRRVEKAREIAAELGRDDLLARLSS